MQLFLFMTLQKTNLFILKFWDHLIIQINFFFFFCQIIFLYFLFKLSLKLMTQDLYFFSLALFFIKKNFSTGDSGLTTYLVKPKATSVILGILTR